ncbi:hypothetical protein TcWFU_005494 [Taenia crassiceps]|uniref:Uncharacterized protein n=1 Tax=Taenia crassiceps TaxID=6207 RepID=A0ABR4PZC0_9CEST
MASLTAALSAMHSVYKCFDASCIRLPSPPLPTPSLPPSLPPSCPFASPAIPSAICVCRVGFAGISHLHAVFRGKWKEEEEEEEEEEGKGEVEGSAEDMEVTSLKIAQLFIVLSLSRLKAVSSEWGVVSGDWRLRHLAMRHVRNRYQRAGCGLSVDTSVRPARSVAVGRSDWTDDSHGAANPKPHPLRFIVVNDSKRLNGVEISPRLPLVEAKYKCTDAWFVPPTTPIQYRIQSVDSSK